MIKRLAAALALGLGLAVVPLAAASASTSASAEPVVVPMATADQNCSYPSGDCDLAVPGSVPGGLQCKSSTHTQACFDPNGHRIWVLDRTNDSYSSVGQWTNWTSWNPPGQNLGSGICVSHLGVGQWGVCDLAFPSGTSLFLSPCRAEGSPYSLSSCAYPIRWDNI